MIKNKDWVQLGSSIVLIVGIGLVIYELRQSKQLAQAQLSSDAVGLAIERRHVAAGEDIASVYARACEAEGPLELADAYRLSNWYSSALFAAMRARTLEEIADFGGTRWKAIAALNIRIILHSPGGREYLDAYLPVLGIPELTQIAESIPKGTSVCGSPVVRAVQHYRVEP